MAELTVREIQGIINNIIVDEIPEELITGFCIEDENHNFYLLNVEEAKEYFKDKTPLSDRGIISMQYKLDIYKIKRVANASAKEISKNLIKKTP